MNLLAAIPENSAPLFALLIDHLPQNTLWYFAPLVLTVSLVYGATRHEYLVPILQHSFRAGIWILTFMGIIFAVLLVVSWML